MKKHLFIIAFLTPLIPFGVTGMSVYAQSVSITGHVQIDTKFSSEIAAREQNLLLNMQKKHDNSSNVNAAIINKHQAELVTLFHPSADGQSSDLIVSLPFASVNIGGQTINTDAQGNFVYNSQTFGNTSYSVSQNGRVMAQGTIDIEPSNSVVLTVQINGADISKNMDINTGANTGNNLTTKSNNVISSTGSFQPYEVGENLGKMWVEDVYNHVSCNKASGDNGYWFPANNSDCANSIAAGYVYDNDPLDYQSYAPGEYCIQESMAAIAGDLNQTENNIYCNGKPEYLNGVATKPAVNWYINGITNSSNQGFNCSSFSFNDHTETLNWNS